MLHGLHATVAPRRSAQAPPVLEKFTFIPYHFSTQANQEIQQFVNNQANFASSDEKIDDIGSKSASEFSNSLLSTLYTPSTLRPFLDVVLENVLTFKLNVCEMSSMLGEMYPHVIHQLADQPKLHVNVTVATTDVDKVQDQDNVTAVNWDLETASTSDLGGNK